MKQPLPFAALILAVASSQAFGAITITSPTVNWTAILYTNPAQADPGKDLQTGGIDGDIVGDANHPSLYTIFDDAGTPSLTDGDIGFRVRVAGDKNPDGLDSYIWIGIDGNSDGKIDLFAGALKGAQIGFYKAGDSANTSPNTTSIDDTVNYGEVAADPANFSFVRVANGVGGNDPDATNLNLDNDSGGSADHNDYFVSFKLSLSALVAGMSAAGIADFDQNTPLRYIAASSTNPNALNQDLNGIDDKDPTFDPDASWIDLDGFTGTYTVAGAVPEPSTALLASLASVLLCIRRRSHGA